MITRRNLLLGLQALATPPAPVLVELFTSEGCSSCPPADRLLSTLISEGLPIIALSEHVDYWNNLGWPDPFSNRIFSERQQWYTNSPYTPQMIVDGVAEFVGSDSNRARSSIQAALKQQKAQVQVEWSDSLEVRIAAFPGFHTDVYLAFTEDGLATEVKRGENGGRVLRHDGVVRVWKPLGSWKTDQPFTARSHSDARYGKAAVFAQDRSSRRIIAAAQVKKEDRRTRPTTG